MRARTFTRRSSALAVVAALGLLGFTSPAHAAAPAAPAPAARVAPVPQASIALPTTAVADGQNPVTVTATGVSRKTPVTIVWGDGSVQRRSTTCSVAKATRSPEQCTVTLSYGQFPAGSFTVEVKSKKRVIASTAVTYTAPLLPWRPPAGWTQPANWAYMNGGATYAPCSTVYWLYDPTGETPERSTIRNDIVTGLGILGPQTGLKFVETTDPAQATMVFNWADLTNTYGGAEGLGGGSNGMSEVTFNSTGEWTTNYWEGVGFITKNWTEGNTFWSLAMPGRGWLVIHETMHALGLGHVDEPTEVMYPIAGASALGPGDIEGLTTLYPTANCPVG